MPQVYKDLCSLGNQNSPMINRYQSEYIIQSHFVQPLKWIIKVQFIIQLQLFAISISTNIGISVIEYSMIYRCVLTQHDSLQNGIQWILIMAIKSNYSKVTMYIII